MANLTSKSAKKRISLWKVVLGSLLGFVLIVVLTVIIRQAKNEPAAADQEIVADRLARLEKHRAEEKIAMASYNWEDKAAGVVRIPMDQAVSLTVEELKIKPVGPSTVPVKIIVAPAPAPAPAPEAKKGS